MHTASSSSSGRLVPRVSAIHDLSCIGRSSLASIIPTLSTLGVQVCPLPTAILSTHLGGFSGIDIYDFTDHIPAFSQHWREEGITFDCIYSGFLASAEQVDYVKQFIGDFTQNNPLVLVDPVMGDEGILYSTYTPKMQIRMRQLVQKADVITPNYTEACFLLGESYREPLPAADEINGWLEGLADMGPEMVVITGIPLAGEKVMNAGYVKKDRLHLRDFPKYIPVQYPGTGDIYASVLLGALLHKKDLASAMDLAAKFITLAVSTTYEARTPIREGVLLERVLPWLSRQFWQSG